MTDRDATPLKTSLNTILPFDTDSKAGLINEWKWRTWVRKKEENIKSGDTIDYEETPAIAPITLGFTSVTTY